MDTLASILADAKKLRDRSIRLLEGVIDGTVFPNPGYTKEEAMRILLREQSRDDKAPWRA